MAEFFFSSVGEVTTNATRKAKKPITSQSSTSNVNGDNEDNPTTEEVDKLKMKGTQRPWMVKENCNAETN